MNEPPPVALRRLAVLGAALMAPVVSASPVPGLPLPELAREVAAAGAAERLDFALIAIDEMAAAFRREVEHIDSEAPAAGDAAARARWSSGTAAYAETLASLGDRALAAGDVAIHVDTVGDVLLFVDGTGLVVAGPRVAEPGLLAGAIAARFCRLHDCGRLLPAPEDDEPATVAVTAAPPPAVEWSFSARGGATCRTEDGFDFLFRDLADLHDKRIACALVVAEFRAIAGRLRQLREQGVLVDLQWLSIDALAGGDGHRLTLNADGAYTRMALPALASTRGLLRAGLLWLEAQRLRRQGRLMLANAGSTLSPVMRLVRDEATRH
ncbi:MAG: hypothetical protein KDC48_16695 [Planctomycetes bacterium]|nr:hypothetical protein [Planctomycetota bacterium]